MFLDETLKRIFIPQWGLSFFFGSIVEPYQHGEIPQCCFARGDRVRGRSAFGAFALFWPSWPAGPAAGRGARPVYQARTQDRRGSSKGRGRLARQEFARGESHAEKFGDLPSSGGASPRKSKDGLGLGLPSNDVKKRWEGARRIAPPWLIKASRQWRCILDEPNQ